MADNDPQTALHLGSLVGVTLIVFDIGKQHRGASFLESVLTFDH